MSGPALDEAVVQIPAFRHFCDAVAGNALSGRHALVLTGGALEEGCLRSGLESALLRNQGPSLRPIFLTDCAEDESPEAYLAKVTGLSEEQFRPTSRAEQPGDDFTPIFDVLLLEGVEQLAPARAHVWLEFFRLTAKYTTATAHVFVLPLSHRPQSLAGMESDTRLALYWWWRRLSVLDMRLVCRLGEQSPANLPEGQWREAVLPHLVVDDLRLASLLWEAVLSPEDTLVRVLQQQGRQRGMDAGRLREAVQRRSRARRESSLDQTPPTDWRGLWEMGAAQCSVEQGPELNVLALAMMEDIAGIRNRLWRGQSELLLPLLTRLRMSICQILTEKHGRSWPLRFGKSFMDEEQQRLTSEDPLSTEFGPLEIVLRRVELGGQRFQPIVQAARQMRNQLAHNKLVTFDEFKALRQMQHELNLA